MRPFTPTPKPSASPAESERGGILSGVQRRGVYEYIPVLARPGQSRMRLIVSGSTVNDTEHPVVLGLQVVERDPGGLLVRIGKLGWAPVLTNGAGTYPYWPGPLPY